MSGIPIIGKVFDEIQKNPVLAVAVVAATVYFTAGASAGAMAPVSEASAAGTSTTAMAGASEAAATSTATATATGTATGAAAAEGATAAGVTGAAETGVAGAGAAEAAGAGTAGIVGSTMPGAATAGAAEIGVTGAAGAGATEAAAAAAAPSWFEAHPMATMLLGQAGIGAVSGYMQEEQQRKREEAKALEVKNARESRGLMGYDFQGNYGGVINNAMVPRQGTAAQAAPIVANQQVQAPTVTNTQQVPVPKSNLPTLNQQGQLVAG